MEEKNSECCGGAWFHRYRIIKTYAYGVLEVCDICRDSQVFRNNIPNHEYLSYHLRQALQPSDKRFIREYNKKLN